MPMTAQPAGLSRKLVSRDTDSVTEAKTTTEFEISYKDDALGKVVIGRTVRVMKGKHKGRWEPKPQPPDEVGWLEPFKRHSDAMGYLLEVWVKARAGGWAPDGDNSQAGAPAAPDSFTGDNPAVQPGDPGDGAPEKAAPDFTIPESADPVPEAGLAEMEGVPVQPAPPGASPGDFQLPGAPGAREDAATAHETESVRVVPVTEENVSQQGGDGPAERPWPGDSADAAAGIGVVVPPADPQVQAEVAQSDDWLDQPAIPPRDPFRDPFETAGFPLDNDDRHPFA